MTLLVAGLLAVAAGGGSAVWVLRRRLAVIDVDGQSMAPTFRTGDRVLVRRVPLHRVRTGDIVVLRRPADLPTGMVPPGATRVGGSDAGRRAAAQARGLAAKEWIIKRAAAVPGDPVPDSVAVAVGAPAGTPVPEGRLVVLGDNPGMSYDSRACGYFSADELLGVVVRRM